MNNFITLVPNKLTVTKKYILIFLVFSSFLGFSQTKKELLTQHWKLDKVESFGQEYDLTENQQNDYLDFTADGKFIGTIEGNWVEGNWSAKDEKISISVNKVLSKTKINWAKVKVLEKDKFALEYQNGDLITTILLFVPKK